MPPTNENCRDAFQLTNQDNTLNTTSQPIIDGIINQTGDDVGDFLTDWNGLEYASPYNFSVIPMYESGAQSGENRPISGNARIGYDCINARFCVAAYLTNDTIGDCNVIESNEDSFVEVGNSTPRTPPTKLKNDTFDAKFEYVKYTGGVNSKTIGK